MAGADALIADLQRERDALFAMLDTVEPDSLTTPGLVGEWSGRDLIAHLGYWTGHAAEVIHLLEIGRIEEDDLPGEIRRIAAFLDIVADEASWASILRHCSFAYMKANATASVPLGGAFWEGGAQTFVHKGTNGRWREVLTPAQSAAYAGLERAS